MPEYHAWTHVPKARGGTDPIPGFGTLPCLRALYNPAGGAAVASATEFVILFETWENENSSIFGETLSAGKLQKVSLKEQGVYTVTVQTIWETAFAFRTENLVLDDSSASAGVVIYGNMSGHAPVSEGGSQFTYPVTSTFTRKWPLLGVTMGDVTAGAYGRLLVKILQASGVSKDVDVVSLDIVFHGVTDTVIS